MRPFVAINHDAQGNLVTAGEYRTILATMFGTAARQVTRRYPLSTFPSPGVALVTLLTDFSRWQPAPGITRTDVGREHHRTVG